MSKPLDVWLRFADCDCATPEEEDSCDCQEESEYEANTYRDGEGFRVDWCHAAVGQVSYRRFDTYANARAWLTSEGFQDFSS